MSKLDTEIDELMLFLYVLFLHDAKGEDALKAFATLVYDLCKRYSIDELITNLTKRNQTTIIARFKKSLELIRRDKDE